MTPIAKYVHTKLVAANWRGLAECHIKAFGRKRKAPERKLKGEWLSSLTAIRNALFEGIHLALPGYEKDGPTLEVFQYSGMKGTKAPSVSHPGFGQIPSQVSDPRRFFSALLLNPYFALGFFVAVFLGFFLSFFLSLFPMIKLLST